MLRKRDQSLFQAPDHREVSLFTSCNLFPPGGYWGELCLFPLCWGFFFFSSPGPLIIILKWEQVAFISFLLASLKCLNLGQVTALEMSTSLQLFLLQGGGVGRGEGKWHWKEVLDWGRKNLSSVSERKNRSKSNGMMRYESIFLVTSHLHGSYWLLVCFSCESAEDLYRIFLYEARATTKPQLFSWKGGGNFYDLNVASFYIHWWKGFVN